ncbi:MAG: hypothetical protein DA408_12310 [Bacteroidetes bacterium]|nr:MAG: hypothetical protein C7N36_10130 [Bacteroidota bacterium]PTM12020.1 MAG: hypothetical protein DA408_12310 [Bacteroidota bacterium]
MDFSFLEKGKTFQATVYRDGDQAYYRTNPLDLRIEQLTVDHTTRKSFRLASGGGLAISLKQ